MSDIFEEVEQGLNEDRMSALWSRAAPFVWAALAVVVIGVGAREYMAGEAKKNTEARSEALESARAALDALNYEAAGDEFTALAEGDAALAPVAAHYLARVRLEGNGDAGAAAEALAGAANPSGDPFEQLATLKAAYLRADEMSLADLEAALGPLPSSETGLGALAQELVAAKALAEGDVDRARTEFGYLRFAANAPQGVVQRAELALAAMPPVAVEEAPLDETTPAEGETPEPPETPAAPDGAEPQQPQEANP